MNLDQPHFFQNRDVDYQRGRTLNVLPALRFSMTAGVTVLGMDDGMHSRERLDRHRHECEEAQQDPWSNTEGHSSTNKYFNSPTRWSEGFDVIKEFRLDEGDASDAEATSQTIEQPHASLVTPFGDLVPTVENSSADIANETLPHDNDDVETPQDNQQLTAYSVPNSKTPSLAGDQAVENLPAMDSHNDDSANVTMSEAPPEGRHDYEQEVPPMGHRITPEARQEEQRSEEDEGTLETSYNCIMSDVKTMDVYASLPTRSIVNDPVFKTSNSLTPTTARGGQDIRHSNPSSSAYNSALERYSFEEFKPVTESQNKHVVDGEADMIMSEALQEESRGEQEALRKAQPNEDAKARGAQLVNSNVQSASAGQSSETPGCGRMKRPELQALCVEREMPKSYPKDRLIQMLEQYDRDNPTISLPAAYEHGVRRDGTSDQYPVSSPLPPPLEDRQERRVDDALLPAAARTTPSILSPQPNHLYQTHLDALEDRTAAMTVSPHQSRMVMPMQCTFKTQDQKTSAAMDTPQPRRISSTIEPLNTRTYDTPHPSVDIANTRINSPVVSLNSQIYGSPRIPNNAANAHHGPPAHTSPRFLHSNPYIGAMQQTNNLYNTYYWSGDTPREGVVHNGLASNSSQSRTPHGHAAQQHNIFRSQQPQMPQAMQNPRPMNTVVLPSHDLPNHNVHPYLPHAAPYRSQASPPASALLASILPSSDREISERRQAEQIMSGSRQRTSQEETSNRSAVPQGSRAQQDSIGVSRYGTHPTPMYAADSCGYRPAQVVAHAVHGRGTVMERGGYAHQAPVPPQPAHAQMTHMEGRGPGVSVTPQQDRTAAPTRDDTPDPLSLNANLRNPFSLGNSGPSEQPIRQTSELEPKGVGELQRTGDEVEASEGPAAADASQQIIPKKRRAPAQSRHKNATGKKQRTNITTTATKILEIIERADEYPSTTDTEETSQIPKKGRTRNPKAGPKTKTASAPPSMVPSESARGRAPKTNVTSSEKPAPTSSKRHTKTKPVPASGKPVRDHSKTTTNTRDEDCSEAGAPTTPPSPVLEANRSAAPVGGRKSSSSTHSATAPRRSSLASVEIPVPNSNSNTNLNVQRRGSAASVRSVRSSNEGKSGNSGAAVASSRPGSSVSGGLSGANVQTRSRAAERREGKEKEKEEGEERTRKVRDGSAAKARHGTGT